MVPLKVAEITLGIKEAVEAAGVWWQRAHE